MLATGLVRFVVPPQLVKRSVDEEMRARKSLRKVTERILPDRLFGSFLNRESIDACPRASTHITNGAVRIILLSCLIVAISVPSFPRCRVFIRVFAGKLKGRSEFFEFRASGGPLGSIARN